MAQPAHDVDDLLTPAEVARLFGVQPSTIARWSSEGRLAFARTPGKHRRYRREDVDALLEKERAS